MYASETLCRRGNCRRLLVVARRELDFCLEISSFLVRGERALSPSALPELPVSVAVGRLGEKKKKRKTRRDVIPSASRSRDFTRTEILCKVRRTCAAIDARPPIPDDSVRYPIYAKRIGGLIRAV